MQTITKEDIQSIANNAVRKAQKDSLDNGIPNVYSKNGIIYFQLSDGTITMNNPFNSDDIIENQVQQIIEKNKISAVEFLELSSQKS